jgi:hypothetical protein
MWLVHTMRMGSALHSMTDFFERPFLALDSYLLIQKKFPTVHRYISAIHRQYPALCLIEAVLL